MIVKPERFFFVFCSAFFFFLLLSSNIHIAVVVSSNETMMWGKEGEGVLVGWVVVCVFFFVLDFWLRELVDSTYRSTAT